MQPAQEPLRLRGGGRVQLHRRRRAALVDAPFVQKHDLVRDVAGELHGQGLVPFSFQVCLGLGRRPADETH